MRAVFQTKINAPINKVAALMADPSNTKAWMEDLQSYEQLSGTPGMPGSQARYVFKNGNRIMTFTSTMQERHLPSTLRSTLSASNMDIAVTARFVAITPTTTLYTSEQEFNFKGILNKIMGFVAQGMIKRQQQRHLEAFKHLAEQD